MGSLLRILRSTFALWPLYVGVTAASVVTALLNLLSPVLIRHATDAIVGGLQDGTGDLHSAATTVVWLAVGLCLAGGVGVLSRNIGGYMGDLAAARMKQILSTRYYAKLLSLPQRYFDSQVTGTIIARLDRSISSITQFLQSMSNNFLSLLVTVVVVVGMCAWYYWPLAALLLILFPVYLWLTAQTSSHWQGIEARKNRHIDVAGGRFAEVVGQIKVAKSFISEPRELADFGQHYQRTVTLTSEQSSVWHRLDTVRGCFIELIFLGVYLIVFLRTLYGAFTVGEMVMLVQMIQMIRHPLGILNWVVDSAQRAIAGSADYFRVMAEIPEHTANKDVVAATTASEAPQPDLTPVPPLPEPSSELPAVNFNHVSFAYEEDKPVLQDISFRVARGQRVGLIGESGGGKSTIVNLLLGLYSPQRGNLEVLGYDAAELTSAQLRASVGVVFQEPNLFSGTIRENIAYGRPNATDTEVEAVARRANAHSFISGFPDGYNTVVGERGLRLSGGQKQRIAVARAMLKDAPILVLDEATSALDTRSERAVQAGLEELMKDRTSIIIAHRLSTIADVDTILTIADGRIDEEGSPAELAVSGGIYSQLLALTSSTDAADRARLARYGLCVEGEDPED